MTTYRYTALVETTTYQAVTFKIDVPDGKSPWGPAARREAQGAALKAPEGEPSTRAVMVRLTSVQEVE